MAARVEVRWIADGALKTGEAADIALAREAGPVWVDLTGTDEPSLRSLADEFGLHPLAIEDCLHFPQRPKMDAFDTGPFVIWLVPKVLEDDRFCLLELDCFVGKGYVITAHREEQEAVDAVKREALDRLPRGPEWILHGILDRMVDGILPLMDVIGDDFDRLEDSLMERPDRAKLRELQLAKRRLRALRRVAAPERDVLRELGRMQAFVSQDAYLYLQDVADHLARIEDSIDVYRDVAASSMDIYLSAVSNNLNDVMKRLTVVATIFMPGTLIVGWYGMNIKLFESAMPYPQGALLVFLMIVVITGGMLLWFKRSRLW